MRRPLRPLLRRADAGRSTASRRSHTHAPAPARGTRSTSRWEKTMSSEPTSRRSAPARCRSSTPTRSCSATAAAASSPRSSIEQLIVPALPQPDARARSTTRPILPVDGGARLAFTTDSYVVTPIFFPGGDIGELAVNGTVNDLAVGGARPLALSLAFILEEGLPLADLRARRSTRRARAADARRRPDRHRRHQGRRPRQRRQDLHQHVGHRRRARRASRSSSRAGARPATRSSLSGTDRRPRHRHPVAARRASSSTATLASDTAPLHELVAARARAPAPTSTRCAIRRAAAWPRRSSRSRRAGSSASRSTSAPIPVRDTVRGACEILGLDPLLVANEGKLVAFVPADGADARRSPRCARIRSARDAAPHRHASSPRHPGFVTVAHRRSAASASLDLPFGESLPRIC